MEGIIKILAIVFFAMVISKIISLAVALTGAGLINLFGVIVVIYWGYDIWKTGGIHEN